LSQLKPIKIYCISATDVIAYTEVVRLGRATFSISTPTDRVFCSGLSFRMPRSGNPESIATATPEMDAVPILSHLWLWIPGSGLRPAPE
jgi:hypothetical protein